MTTQEDLDAKKQKEKLMAALLWLECKQVLRGGVSTFFPDLDKKSAAAIRGLGGVDAVQEWMMLSKTHTPA